MRTSNDRRTSVAQATVTGALQTGQMHEEGDALLEDAVVPPSRRLTAPRRRRSSATRKRGGRCSTYQQMGVPDTRRAYAFNARIATTPINCRMPTGISTWYWNPARSTL